MTRTKGAAWPLGVGAALIAGGVVAAMVAGFAGVVWVTTRLAARLSGVDRPRGGG